MDIELLIKNIGIGIVIILVLISVFALAYLIFKFYYCSNRNNSWNNIY